MCEATQLELARLFERETHGMQISENSEEGCCIEKLAAVLEEKKAIRFAARRHADLPYDRLAIAGSSRRSPRQARSRQTALGSPTALQHRVTMLRLAVDCADLLIASPKKPN